MSPEEIELVKIDYEYCLRDLTSISKPIINNLTTIANELQEIASEIATLIENRFINISKEMKLPALYLIDSILKNVGGEYVQIFSQDIFKNFVKCFNEVDDPVKQKFLKVLETWSLIFSADIIESIKSTVLGTKKRTIEQAPPVENKRRLKSELVDLDDFVLLQQIIMRPKLFGSRVLYEELSLQCNNCGFRFPDTISGKSRMTLHLDSHFRKNRRLKDRARKAVSRDWFLPASEWILQSKVDRAEKEASPMFFDIPNTEQEKEVGVTVPSSEFDEKQKCKVCQEVIENEWDDEMDEWVYKRVLRVKDGIQHVNCTK